VTGSRPQKKAKAKDKSATLTAIATESPTAKEAIVAKLHALSAGSRLSDYEKCSIFPQKLMQLLKNEEDTGAIWWLDDGECFAIEQEQFTKVMNKVSRTSKKKVKLDSILRNLYRWGFKKLKDKDLPPNVLAYSHPNFKRDACVELQTFCKKAEGSSARRTCSSPFAASSAAAVPGAMPAPTALARALSARAEAGYGDNWNDEGAADKPSITQHDQYVSNASGRLPQVAGAYPRSEEEPMMLHSMLLQQQQQHRQMLLQQELLFQEQQQHRHHQALLLGAAATQRAAMEHYSTHRLGGVPPSVYRPPHHPPGYPY
jgi:HSF-type DNA-binding